jgi:hypothetical protein
MLADIATDALVELFVTDGIAVFDLGECGAKEPRVG